ncbi:MAG: adenosine kinase [Paracoccaceae bacterium]|jgi:sugar/nucleoside kinase (ribokinase family)|nr:adenosine kinase [Paracoccaceae bacterium]|tara:strand:- start:3196 stop:4185 length:990 start_codon:yes stop_codon:yes gene_type:complete
MKKYKVLGIGNAVVDVISQSSDLFLKKMDIEKGIMQLVDRERGELLYNSMDNRKQAPGGSVANTIAGIGSLGLRTGFIGKVGNDELGTFYRSTMEENGTDFVNELFDQSDLPTSRSMIFVSDDGERSMNTYLGISAELGPEDVNLEVASNAEIVFLEGYLFDKDKGKDAFVKLAKECRSAGGLSGIAISDPFCVERHRPDFLSLIKNELDYVIGNKEEIMALFQTDNLENALSKAADISQLVVCTRSSEGVTAIQDGNRVDFKVKPITPVDATGAGDQFAAGFLYGLAMNSELEVACSMGCICAEEVISHVGPRPEVSMINKFSEMKLI